MSITHTFTDAIVSIFLGAPDADHALSVLPGHKLLQEGHGYKAVALTTIGSLFAVLIMTILIPIILKLMSWGYPIIQPYIVYILILASLALMLKESKSRFWAFTTYLLSGILGLAVLNSNLSQPLLPLFSGLFGVSILVTSITQKTTIPKQKIEFPDVNNKDLTKALTAGTSSSLLTGSLPGLGSAQAAIISTSVYKNIKPENFLIVTGSINTFVMFISFIGLLAIDKARSGSVVVISKILESFTLNHLILFTAISLIVAGIASILTLKIAIGFSNFIRKVNYSKLCIGIILFVALLVIILTGPLGFLVLIVATFTGVIPTLKGIGKNHLMGSLLFPIILFLLL